jgi:hypothetical protein
MKIEIKPNGVTLFGNALVLGNVTMNQDLTVLGKATINGVGLVTIQQIENLFVTNNATFNNKVFISGPLSVSTGITVSGTLNGNGSLSFTSNLNNITINSNGITISSNISITGFTTCNGSIYVSGNSTFNSQLSVNNGLLINGDVTMNSSNIFLSGNVGINGGLFVTGSITGINLYISGNTTLNSKVFLNDGMFSSGNVTMNGPNITLNSSNIYLSGNVNISGGILVTGSIAGSNLYISGNSTFNSLVAIYNGLAISGNITMNASNIFISGTLGISGGLIVTGSITGINLYISGNTTFNSQLSVNNGLFVSGNVTMNSSKIYFSGNVNITGGLIVSGSSTFDSIEAKNIFVNNTKTTPVFSTFLDINGSSTNFNITYGNNLYIANPYIPSIITNTLNVGQITSMSFSGTDYFVGGLGGKIFTSVNYGLPQPGITGGRINSLLYNPSNKTLYIAGTFPKFDSGTDSTKNIARIIFDGNLAWDGFSATDLLGAEVNVINRGKGTSDIWVGLNAVVSTGNIKSLGYIDSNSSPNLYNQDDYVPSNCSINDILVTGTKVYIAGNLSGATTSLFKVNSSGNANTTFIDVTGLNLNGPINSIAIDTLGDFYLGGSFTFSGSKNIVKYNSSSQNFETLGAIGLLQEVNKITLDNLNTLYAGTSSGLYRYNSASSQFEIYPSGNSANVNLLINRNGLYYSNNTSLNYFPLRYSFLTYSNTVYDGGSTIKSVQFKDSGDNIQIAASSDFGTVISKSSNLTINYN